MDHRGIPRSDSTAADQQMSHTIAESNLDPHLGQPNDDADFADDLTCPGCGTILHLSGEYERYRVCSSCRRHFPLPAREWLRLLIDPESFIETNSSLVSVDPIVFRDPLPIPDRLAEARERAASAAGPGGGLGHAVMTGIGTFEGNETVLILLDHAYLSGSIGLVAGEKIVLAMELAAARRLPLVAICAAGGARTDAGILSLVQLAKMASAATQLHRAGVPFVSVLAHPTTGGIYAGLANQADLVLAEPGAQIGFVVRQVGDVDAAEQRESPRSESLQRNGLIDAVVDRSDLRSVLVTLIGLFADRGAYRPRLPATPASLPGPTLPAWETASLACHPRRPSVGDYQRRLLTDFLELHGDRIGADDPTVLAGLGRLGGVPIAFIGMGYGDDGGSRNGGLRVTAAGFRKAMRVMRLAGHLELPIVALIDSPGAAIGDDAERDGIGMALAQAFALFTMLPVPIVTAVTGEGGRAGAFALGIGDRMLMQEHAVYIVAGAEMTASVGFPDAVRHAASWRGSSSRLTARDCLGLGVVDGIVPEPPPAAHADPDEAARLLATAIAAALTELSRGGPRGLLEHRGRKVRNLGQATPEGRDAARRELRELQELQQSVARSLGDLRDRWDARQRGRPRLHRPTMHRPDFTELASRLAARRSGSLSTTTSCDDNVADPTTRKGS